MSNKISILVVIYNKQLVQSLSIKGLNSCLLNIENLMIVNNGPKSISFQNYRFSSNINNVDFVEFLNNRPLSLIYNDFVHKYNTDYFLILDDDTSIDDSFVNFLKEEKNIDLEIPKIFSDFDGKIYYPILNKKVIDYNVNDIQGNVFSIGSGLVISKRLIEKFDELKEEVFDTRFALYGVDTSFFYKINKLQKKEFLKISSKTNLKHGLSIANKKEWSKKREFEVLIDEVLTLKYYKKIPSKYLILKILKLIVKFDIKTILLLYDVYNRGAHPRCFIN